MKIQLVFPMAFYALYMGCLGIIVFWSRYKAIKGGEVSPKYYKAHSGEKPPSERLIIIGRHYDNQFQVPMLFFIVCSLHMVLGLANLFTLVLAWLFVVARLLHTRIHLGTNFIPYRAGTFMLSWLVVLLLWAQLVYFALAMQ